MTPDDSKDFNLLWWNIDKRLPLILNFKQAPIHNDLLDLIFVSETCLGCDALPRLEGYETIADPTIRTCSHGGMAFYVKRYLFNHVMQLKFGQSFISLCFDICPAYVFIGTYIKPESSRYFESEMFSELCAHIIGCHENSKTVFMGGDLNSRPGDLNKLTNNSLWNFACNVDKNTNAHGRNFFAAICEDAQIMPVNHLKYKNKEFVGDFTYQKGDTRSQIDFAMTDSNGRKCIIDFIIIQDNWHLADHKPIMLKLSLPMDIDLGTMYQRAAELNYEPEHHATKKLARYNKLYNYENIERYLVSQHEILTCSIARYIESNDIENAVVTLDNALRSAHKAPGSSIKKQKNNLNDINIMDKVNVSFNKYRSLLSSPSTEEKQLDDALNVYIKDRKRLHFDVLKRETDSWQNVIQSSDSKDLWDKIDWKGNLASKKPAQHPSMEDLQSYFSELYDCKDDRELDNIANLNTDVTIPILDQPIDINEVKDSLKDMKNGGFDFNIPVISILVNHFSATLVLILNFIFYVKYPIHLAMSILCVLPKKGNLRLPKNFRGIQMMRAVACLFDRVIARRLYTWMSIENEQSAFQKGKSTLFQIFILRLIIEICKKKKQTIYIAFVDLEKAFDRVSRYRLLARLVALGIGKVMLETLKRIYSYTFCVLSFYGCFSDMFVTRTGIRQGSASSVLLFILFMDGLFAFLRTHCRPEAIIKEFHTLIHADDTVIISTDRELFMHKCDTMMLYFEKKQLNLNLSKSSYLIINPMKHDKKCSIKLKKGYLDYKSSQRYLGIIISDDGSIKHDVETFIKEKRGNVIIKFTNFCSKNPLAPIKIKLQVLDSCVLSSLSYAAETWANNGSKIEAIYRYGLRTALNIRQTINNEIIYVETDKYPVKCSIVKKQLKFWLNIKEYMKNNPECAMKYFVMQAQALKIPYIKHYEQLENVYQTPDNCIRYMRADYRREWKYKFEQSLSDKDSRLETYLRINPMLCKPLYISKVMLETDRIILSRFRCGSHSLRIELGRFARPRIPRENRTCCCNHGLQTVLHCFTECTLVTPILDKTYTDLQSIFDDDMVCINLFHICKILKIPF